METLRLIQLGFVITTIGSYSFFFLLLRRSIRAANFSPTKEKKVFIGCLAAIIGWTIVISVLSLIGFFNNFQTIPPRLVIVLIVPLIAIIWAIYTDTGKEIIKHSNTHSVIYLQSFRIAVEILLWMLFLQDLLPVQLTLEGRNFDILSGLTAPIVGFLLARRKVPGFVVILWNFVCLGLLINVVSMAILSMPTPFRMFLNDPANTVVGTFPVVWLPGLLVPLAYGLHFFSLRQLFQGRNTVD
jgi:hypothetical protein